MRKRGDEEKAFKSSLEECFEEKVMLLRKFFLSSLLFIFFILLFIFCIAHQLEQTSGIVSAFCPSC